VATGPHKDRVDVAKISIYYVVLLRWDNVTAFAKQESVPWPLEDTKADAWSEFERMWHKIGIASAQEGSCNITCYKARVFPAAADPTAKLKTEDAAAVGAAPARKHDLKYMSFHGFDGFNHE
jgi:hypothetical protein